MILSGPTIVRYLVNGRKIGVNIGRNSTTKMDIFLSSVAKVVYAMFFRICRKISSWMVVRKKTQPKRSVEDLPLPYQLVTAAPFLHHQHHPLCMKPRLSGPNTGVPKNEKSTRGFVWKIGFRETGGLM